jgi:hypothetical protein
VIQTDEDALTISLDVIVMHMAPRLKTGGWLAREPDAKRRRDADIIDEKVRSIVGDADDIQFAETPPPRTQ